MTNLGVALFYGALLVDDKVFGRRFRPAKERWVPHISLVFREMWDTASLSWRVFKKI
jgi:hypothetical protein